MSSQLLRTSLRLLAVLVFFGALFATSQSTASAAAPCPPTCTSVTIYNCVWPPVIYQVKFAVCCNGTIVVMPPFTVPVAVSPTICSVTTYAPTPTSSCPVPVVVGVASISPAPPGGFVFDPINCTLKIF